MRLRRGRGWWSRGQLLVCQSPDLADVRVGWLHTGRYQPVRCLIVRVDGWSVNESAETEDNDGNDTHHAAEHRLGGGCEVDVEELRVDVCYCTLAIASHTIGSIVRT